jgi:DNA-directed RNA polymerase subunit RPC12/RpoP
MRDIYFKCKTCGKNLVVDRSAAGYSAECPGCRSRVVVPHRSAVPPKVWRWTGLVAGNLVLVVALVSGGVYLITKGDDNPGEAPAGLGVALAPSPLGRAADAGDALPELDPELLERHQQLEQENRKLAANYQALNTQFEDLGNWVMQNVRGKFPMPDRLVSKLRVSPVADDYSVNPDLAELLNMDPAEQSKLNDALRYTRTTLSQIEAQLVQVTEATPFKATLYVPPFEKEGQQLKEDLYGALESTLGGPRADRFHDVTQEEMEKSFDHFGMASRTLVFEVTPNPVDPNNPYLLIKDGWILPDGESARSISVKETAVWELPEDYHNYVSLLPENIAAYAVK